MENDPKDELGRRILAALMSYQLGYAGVDRSLKQLRQRPIDPEWGKLGMVMLSRMMESLDSGVEFKPPRIQ